MISQHNAERLLKLIDEVYRWLPLGTIVNNRVLVVHGGISDSTDLDLIRSLDRGKVSYCGQMGMLLLVGQIGGEWVVVGFELCDACGQVCDSKLSTIYYLMVLFQNSITFI